MANDINSQHASKHKTAVAVIERFDSLLIPQMPCPLVQPPIQVVYQNQQVTLLE